MSFPILAVAQALTEFVPLMARWLGGDEGEKTAQKIVGIAQKITGENDPEALLKALKTNPSLMAQFQKAIFLQKLQQRHRQVRHHHQIL